MKKYYAGIGSRETPDSAKPTIAAMTAFLTKEGYVLRSGGAPGADTMFEEANTGEKEIYLPWYCFQSNYSPLCRVTEEAILFSLKFHPAPERLSQGARQLMGRNAYQVLGMDLKTKSDFLVCWTVSGATDLSSNEIIRNSGGTGQAMRIAKAYGVPFFNLKDKSFSDFEKWYCEHNFDIL